MKKEKKQGRDNRKNIINLIKWIVWNEETNWRISSTLASIDGIFLIMINNRLINLIGCYIKSTSLISKYFNELLFVFVGLVWS